jgi:hypothetical protein
MDVLCDGEVANQIELVLGGVVIGIGLGAGGGRGGGDSV